MSMRWNSRVESPDSRTRRYLVLHEGRAASFGDVLRGWEEDEGFRSYFISLLREAPFGAFRWETQSATWSNVERDFEFVLIDSPGLDRRPEAHVFDEQIGKSKDEAVAFANLGGDATLVVPREMTDPSAYVHLASCVRRAPREQVDFLFRLVGRTVLSLLGESPLWVSTAGMGVAWLHVRIDSRPKYYGYLPYTR